MTRRKLLMAVYNPIEVDGRVKRACESLAAEYDLTLICPSGKDEYQNSLYRIHRVRAAVGADRISKLLGFWWHLIRLARSHRPDIVYAHDFFLPFPGLLAARLSGSRFVYDAHELIVPAAAEKLRGKARLFYNLERLVVRRANLVIAANPERAEIMREHYGLSKAPISVGNVPPRATAVLSDEEVVRRYPGMKRNAAGDIHVVYMGDMSFERGLNLLVDASALLPENFRMIFVGGGPDLSKLQAQAAAQRDGRIVVLGPVPHAHVHDVIRQADIGYVSYSMNGLNNVLCAPNKVFEYANAGLSMLATCQPTIRRMFEAHPIGRLVGCDGAVKPEAIALGLQAVAADLARYKNAIDAFLSGYSWNNEATRLVSSVNAVFS